MFRINHNQINTFFFYCLIKLGDFSISKNNNYSKRNIIVVRIVENHASFKN